MNSKFYKKACKEDFSPPGKDWTDDRVKSYTEFVDGMVLICHERGITLDQFWEQIAEETAQMEWEAIKPTEYDPIQDESLNNPYAFLKDV